MDNPELNVVTGAFGYSGKYIAKQLLAMGERVRTFTGHPQRDNPFGDAVQVAPLDFGCPSALARSLEGATTLYNTYWVRFPYGEVTFEKAVQNTKILIEATGNGGCAQDSAHQHKQRLGGLTTTLFPGQGHR